MQHINDDIDELFKNAADNYPLKINGADWESVAGRLKDEENDKEFAPLFTLPAAQTTNRGYRYLLLLLLLPLGFFAAKYAGWTGGGNNNTGEANNTKIAPAPTDKAKQGDAPANSTSPNTDNTATGSNSAVSPAENAENPVTGSKGTIKGAVISSPAISKKETRDITASTPNRFPLSDVGKAKELADMQVAMQQRQEKSESVNNPVNSSSAAPSPVVKGNNAKDDETKNAANTDLVVNAGKLPEVAQPEKENKIEPKVSVNTREKRFYIGAFVAPEYTTIKYQPGNKVGFNFGGLIGYSFSKSLALEVGISTDKKYYTTDGKYFNSDQKWLVNSGKLLTLSGYSSLTEFPVNVKYNFKPGKDGNFFVSGGLVSYVVHEENYDYEFDKGGYIYHKDKSSRNSTTSMFADINISAGYESSLGNFCNFRIEPYYRIPVKGIGVGSLPITSVGLNIGITKKIK